MAIFDLGERGQRLLVIVHHFAMDGLSWRPFWEDFESIYQGIDGRTSASPTSHSTSFREWAHALKERADSAELHGDMHAWLDLDWERVRPIPLDAGDEGANTNGSAREVILELSMDETRSLLHETSDVRHKVDLLLTALAETTAEWTGSETILFDMMGHGRDEDAFEQVDLFGTVGFFISYTPMVLTLSRPEPSAARAPAL